MEYIPSSWTPELFGFYKAFGEEHVYYNSNFELRRIGPIENDVWLLRKRVTNERGNKESLVKFFQYIPYNDYEFAQKLLLLYLYPKSAVNK